MTRPQVIHVASVAELRSLAALWDDLWWRSDVTTPALRAELITLWMEHFAPHCAVSCPGRGRAWALGGRPAAGRPPRRRHPSGGRHRRQPLVVVRRSALGLRADGRRCRRRRRWSGRWPNSLGSCFGWKAPPWTRRNGGHCRQPSPAPARAPFAASDGSPDDFRSITRGPLARSAGRASIAATWPAVSNVWPSAAR